MDTQTHFNKNILYLHIAVMLFGLAGVVAQFVEVSAVMVALGRVICSSALLLIIALVKKDRLRLDSKRDVLLIILTGAVMAAHWTTFFQSIQVSTVAIGTITFSTFPLFLTFLEPIIFHEKIRRQSIFSAIILFIGVLITIPEFSMANDTTIGIIWGMICSLTYAILTLANRYFSARYAARTICLYEQGSAAVVLLPALFLVETTWRAQDIAGVAFVGFICTAFAHSLYVSAQKSVKAQTAGIVSGMETVYGIVYALLFLGEIPTIRELVGGAVILGVAMYSSLKAK
ncbi:EamA family transporter [Lachnospiraceae bacterium WCA-9-b2]|jgi:Permeases of the drug/metabolite transporter (DMT) superfamily|uniref:EamA family transporter n=1 Tax=Sporofaciens musculi TaxID=2681861 RepID=A0A7X3MCN1_9FIRM|nr:DMT family transporter [Sporofaciens musculi]MXP73964.1 EamA family transporter [Sporofaciens musculi]